MNPDRTDPQQVTTPFEAWKLKLQEDCVACGRLLIFNELNDNVLKLFWKRGVDPTVEAILADGLKNKTKSE